MVLVLAQAALEKEVSALQLSVRGHQDEAIALRRERDGLTIKHEHAIKRVTEVSQVDSAQLSRAHSNCRPPFFSQLTTSLHERAAAIEVETAARKAADEAATKAQRELKSYKAVSGPVSFSGGSDEIKELREYNNDLQVSLGQRLTVTESPKLTMRDLFLFVFFSSRKCSNARLAVKGSNQSPSLDVGICFARSASTRDWLIVSASVRVVPCRSGRPMS